MSYRGFLAELLLAEYDDRARRRSERGIKAAAFPRDSRCAYPRFMSFSRLFGQVGTLRMRPQHRAVVAGYLCGTVVDRLSAWVKAAMSEGLAMREPGRA